MLVMLAIWFSILLLIVLSAIILNWENLFNKNKSESFIDRTSKMIFYGFILLD